MISSSNMRKGQLSIQAVLAVVIGLVVIMVVALPVIQDTITQQNFTGTVGTIVDTVPIFIAVGALVLAGSFFLFRGR